MRLSREADPVQRAGNTEHALPNVLQQTSNDSDNAPFMQSRLLGLLGVDAVIFAWAKCHYQRPRQDARQKLGCNRRSRAAVGNVWNGLAHLVLHRAEVCPARAVGCCFWRCSVCCSVVRAQALFARPCSHRPISGRNRRRPDSSQESMREQPEPRTQHRTAKRKTGFQFIITTSPLNCRWTQRRAQGAQITGTASTSSRSNPGGARTRGPAFFVPVSFSRLGTSDRQLRLID